MPDLLRIKQNVSKMVDMGAPEEEIDQYIVLEGTTVEAVRDFKLPEIPYTKEQLSRKVIPQFTKGLYEKLPFGIGKRIVSALPNAQAIQEIQEGTPAAQGIFPSLARLAGEVSPDIAMMTPFIGAAGAIPKIPSLLKLATGIGAYSGTKAGLTEGPERILPEAGKAFATTAALGYAGKGLIKGGKAIGKGIDYLKKSAADYVTTKVAPRAYTMYQNAVQKFTPQIQKFAEEKLKIPSSAINTIKKLGVDTVQKVRQAYQDSTDSIYQKIQQGFVNKWKQADIAYQQAIKEMPSQIDSGKFFKTTQDILRQKGFVDLQGNPTTRFKSGLDPIYDDLVNMYLDMKNALTSKGKKVIGNVISKEDFSLYRDKLGRLLRDRPSDRTIMAIRNSLYNDAEKAGAKGLINARNLEAQAFRAEEELNKIALLKEKGLDKFHKLSQEQIRQLREVEKYIGENFIDDLDALTAGRYLDDFAKVTPESLALELENYVAPAKTPIGFSKWKDILGESQAKQIFNEIIAHRRGIKLKYGGLTAIGLTTLGGGIKTGLGLLKKE